MLIYKIVHFGEWRDAEASGEYAGSAKDRADGFLHFSLAEQLQGTLSRHYAGQDGLALVAVDRAALGDALKFEASSNGEHYPHLYAALPLIVVQWIRALKRGEGGEFVLPV